MTPIFAVGDIHGYADQLDKALERIASDAAHPAPVVFVGDYIDRGPDSRGVIDRLLAGQEAGEDWVCLQGNHDTFLPDFLAGPDETDPQGWIGPRWLRTSLGGAATLASYGVDSDDRRAVSDIRADALEAVPQVHANWLSSRPRVHETDAQVFVHAGIRPGIALEDQDPYDLIWIRHPFLEDPTDHGRLIVHGHTPGDLPEHRGNRVNVDGGTGFGRPLYPVLLLGREAFLIGPFGRAAL